LIDSLSAASGITSSVLGWPLTITRHALVGLLHEEGDLLRDVRAPAALVLAVDARLAAGLPVGSERGPVGVLRPGDHATCLFGQRLGVALGLLERALGLLDRLAQGVELGLGDLVRRMAGIFSA
jgi:hypothetical protein